MYVNLDDTVLLFDDPVKLQNSLHSYVDYCKFWSLLTKTKVHMTTCTAIKQTIHVGMLIAGSYSIINQAQNTYLVFEILLLQQIQEYSFSHCWSTNIAWNETQWLYCTIHTKRKDTQVSSVKNKNIRNKLQLFTTWKKTDDCLPLWQHDKSVN